MAYKMKRGEKPKFTDLGSSPTKQVAGKGTQIINGVLCDAYGNPVGPSNPENSKADYSQPKAGFSN